MIDEIGMSERIFKDDSQVVAYVTRRTEMQFTELRKALGGAGLWGKVRSSALDLLHMRCLLDT